ncbi:uncharacterized protein [Zea mays]|uniref:Uncharacterized protein n=1 Tax=Zea mays TaxID=4577 RepID=A0A1D6NUU0_MAIZE|nr:uncharacterized protein LOC103638040 [Zea mays]AQL01908.1 hypothetical protein ZEAMMB73_Zm00001d045257 [Zea mays]|eukprot:XP_008659265.1 uncharacterized protein LOC103638040 [Zea mays]
MNRFPDRGFVRLRNRAYGTYLFADDDGAGVMLKPHRASLQAVWQVDRVVRRGRGYIVLRSAAYGRHLICATGTSWVDQSHEAYHTVQGNYNNPEQVDILWAPVHRLDNVHVVMLQGLDCQRILRACAPNTPFFRYVFVDAFQRSTNYGTMADWTVETIPVRPAPTVIPLPVPPLTEGVTPLIVLRRIKYVRADANGLFNPGAWLSWLFVGNSLLQLKQDLEMLLNVSNITMYVRAGPFARWTPLVIDLPSHPADMEIFVMTAMTPAMSIILAHPDFDA